MSLLSVIVPAFNAAASIDVAIDSVLSETHRILKSYLMTARQIVRPCLFHAAAMILGCGSA